MRLASAALLTLGALAAQSPFTAAKDHYKLVLDNDWVQIARVSYEPGGTSPEHDHPAKPTVYIYVTDGGPLEFRHDGKPDATRPAVKAGQIRFARPVAERHEVHYLGDKPAEYIRIELKTEYLDPPAADVRIPAKRFSGEEFQAETVFENGQITIRRSYGPVAGSWNRTKGTGIPLVLVNLEEQSVDWIAPEATTGQTRKGNNLQISLKSKPVRER